MRLATITNWAYGATVALTLASGATMLLASAAQEQERAAVAQRYQLDRSSAIVARDVYELTEQARQYVTDDDPAHLIVYRNERAELGSAEARVRQLRDAGAAPEELAALKDALRWADSLHDEQEAAIAARQADKMVEAHRLVFGQEYQRGLDRVEAEVQRFQDRLDQRTAAEVRDAERLARLWRGTSETVLGVTGLLFLCVLFFLFKQRVLRPVVRLSDVMGRLAGQDYAVEPPDFGRVDEIGDMAQAIRIFRENGLERQRLEEEKAADRAMRDLLSRMTNRLQSCDNLDDLKDVVRRFVPEILPDLAGSLYLLDRTRNAMVALCDWLSPRHSKPEFSPLSCWALRRGGMHRPAGAAVDVPCDHLDHAGGALPDTICVPLTAHRETLGLLYFERRAAAGEGTAATEVYLEMLAENIGLAIGNLQLRETLREMAMADSLTGLANRRHFADAFETESAEALRSGSPLSCLLLDVDHFKQFNDRFGHDAGDAVLREVGAVLRGATREQGLAFRYGGEEFLLLLPGLDAEQAAARAEDVRQRIARLDLRHNGQALGSITASVGVATTPLHGGPDRLIAAADSALMRAKEAGRDRVIVAVQRSEGQRVA